MPQVFFKQNFVIVFFVNIVIFCQNFPFSHGFFGCYFTGNLIAFP